MSRIEFRDLGWRWRPYAGQLRLIADAGYDLMVLAPQHGTSLLTRDTETGEIRKLDPSDEVAKLIAAAPEIRRYATSLIHGIDIGLVTISSDADDTLLTILGGLRAALAKAGDA